MILALRDAFKAGVKQGEDQATSYEWGSYPHQSEEEAFMELFERWESGWDGKFHIRKALRCCK